MARQRIDGDALVTLIGAQRSTFRSYSTVHASAVGLRENGTATDALVCGALMMVEGELNDDVFKKKNDDRRQC